MIARNYPGYVFEEGFEEDDPLWEPLLRETDSAQDARSKSVLDDVFRSDNATYVSVSSHSGEIGSLLRGWFFWFLFSLFFYWGRVS